MSGVVQERVSRCSFQFNNDSMQLLSRVLWRRSSIKGPDTFDQEERIKHDQRSVEHSEHLEQMSAEFSRRVLAKEVVSFE